MEWKYVWIDVAVFGVVGLSFYTGYKRGLINQVVWLGSFVVGYLAASRFCHPIAEGSGIKLYADEVTVAVAFVVVFLVIITVMHILARTISRALKPTVVGLANSILGALFTSLIYVVLMLVVLNLALILFPDIEDTLEKTWVASHGADLIDFLMERTPLDEIPDRIKV
jgi:membrane protein required for colicin V production